MQDGLAAPEIDISGRKVLQALIKAPMIAEFDEGIDLLPEIAGQVTVFPKNAALHGLVSTPDLALGLRMIWGTADMIHLLVFQPIGQFALSCWR